MASENIATGEILKKVRKKKGLTLSDVAQQMGCTNAFISMFENGRTGISLANLQKLLKVYDMTMADLVEDEQPNRVVSLDNAKHLGNINTTDGVETYLLVRNPQNKQIEPILFRIHPGETVGPMQHKGEEFGYVIEGEFEVTLVDPATGYKEVYILKAGDTIYYESEMQHYWYNTSSDQVGVFIGAVTPPSF